MGVSGYTPSQLRGVTDTGDAESSARYLVEDSGGPGEWDEPTLDEAAYGEIEALIPGEGEAAEDCGVWVPKQFCDGDDAHVHLGQHLCGRRECPRCWNSQWAEPRATSVVQRLAAGRWAEPDGPDRRLVHGSISPPEGSMPSPTALFEGRSEAVDLAREHGIRGAVVIAHGYRPTSQTKRRFGAAKDAGFEGGIWRFIRENERSWYGQVYWSPHYHVVGLCRDFVEGDDDADDGWVVQNHSTGLGVEPNPGVDRRFSPFENLRDVDPYEDMIAVVRYLLSHATFVENRQAVTWMGDLHGTNFDPEEAISRGSWMTIQRRVEELIGEESDRPDDTEGDPEEPEECPEEGCDGFLHPIWEVQDYLDQRGDDLELEAQTRLITAFDWALGDDDSIEAPADGWPRPRTEQAARAAFEELQSGSE